MNHLISRQRIELKTGSSRDAFRLQHELSGLFWRAVAPELERLFDQMAPSDTLVRIDKLEIDLGRLSEESLLEGRFLPQLRQLLEEALAKAMREQGPGVQRLTLAEGHFEHWLQFLEKGFLNWDTQRPAPDWLEGVKETLGKSSFAVEKLRQLLQRHRLALQRLLLQHTPDFLVSLTELFTSHKQQVLAMAGREWQKLLAASQVLENTLSGISRAQKERLFWEQILRAVIIQQQKKPALNLLEDALAHLIPAKLLAVASQAVMDSAQDFETLRPVLEQILARQLPPVQRHRKQSRPGPMEKGANIPENQKEEKPEEPKEAQQPGFRPSDSPPHDQPDTLKTEKQETPLGKIESLPGGEERPYPIEQVPKDAALFVPNGGIVLLHAFLVRFFDVLGLLDGSDFRDESGRQRAIYLLHYLAAGQEAMPEYELVLPKFLCGLPLNIPLSHEVALSAEEKEECEGLLEAVIGNWGALGEASPDALREAFLQRPGKLRKRDTGWLLEVEKDTLDILLDRLPWSISIVKLPWMDEMLRVEWR